MVRDQKAFGRGKLSLVEVKLVAGLRSVVGLVVGVDEVDEVDGLLHGVAVKAEFGANVTIEIVVLEDVASTEDYKGQRLWVVDLLHHRGEVGVGVERDQRNSIQVAAVFSS